jgi:hypothetical protein
MKVVHGPKWLKSIGWYYTKHGPFNDVSYSPINYIVKEDTTFITLIITLNYSMRWPIATGYYVVPEKIKTALSKLGELWSYKANGATKIVLTGKFKGIVSRFHNIPLKVARKISQ